jgi:hypothetical protein
MRYALSCLAIGLCALIANPPASASERHRASAADISAAKKTKQLRDHRRQHVHVRAARRPDFARRGWMDPSFGPDGRPYPNPYPPTTCSSDMGYGRFTTCDFHE